MPFCFIPCVYTCQMSRAYSRIGTVGRKHARVCHIAHTLCRESPRVAIVPVDSQARVAVLDKIPHQEVVVGLVPACAFGEGGIQFAEHACAAVGKCAVHQAFHHALCARLRREDGVRVVAVLLQTARSHRRGRRRYIRSPRRPALRSRCLRRPVCPASPRRSA